MDDVGARPDARRLVGGAAVVAAFVAGALALSAGAGGAVAAWVAALAGTVVAAFGAVRLRAAGERAAADDLDPEVIRRIGASGDEPERSHVRVLP